MPASVLTLARGREAQLANLMRGLARQATPPAELVIAWMQPAPAGDLPDPGCPVRHLVVPGEPMPLAAARNRAAEAAASDLLVFLDVDCVPGPGLVAAYARAAGEAEGLLLGEVLYLPEDALDGGLDFARLDRLGRAHPSKPPVPEAGLRAEPDAGQLWGLSFALPRRLWAAVGGMDEGFSGYGAEETDLAWRLAVAGGRAWWVAGARAYHQHHAVSVPPLPHFDDILRNAARFRARHGRWCMEYWLGGFRDAGLIDWSPEAEAIRPLRRPTAAELAAARRPGDVLFS